MAWVAVSCGTAGGGPAGLQTSFHAEQLDAEEHAARVEGIAGGLEGQTDIGEEKPQVET
jgi:hypothetical protein